MFLLFGGDFYYAAGGCNDYISMSPNLSQLIETANQIEGHTMANQHSIEWWHIVPADDPGNIVARSDGQAYF